MSARHRRAARILAAMPLAERLAVRAEAEAAIVPPTGNADSLPAAFVAGGLWHEADAERRKVASKAKRQDATAIHMLSTECPRVSALWDRLGELLASPLPYRQVFDSLPRSVRRYLTERTKPSDWIGSAAVSHCMAWVVRPVRASAARPSHPARYRAYPLGYASARGAWRYRSGAERSAVQGYTGSVQVTIRHSERLAFVDPKVQAEAVAHDVDPMLAVKWTQAADRSLAPFVVDTFEPVDFSLQASGINTGKGYSHERSGKAYDPRSFAGKIAALAGKVRPELAVRAEAARQAEAERRKAEAKRQADIVLQADRMRPRLVRG